MTNVNKLIQQLKDSSALLQSYGVEISEDQVDQAIDQIRAMSEINSRVYEQE